ncbi:MAG: LysR family transcriptional regulator [Eubacteriales bacterium]|nr:LysR family transcriptional regulator [Eubacteriales bacterium]
MTLLQLKYVETIARCGSFSKASHLLYVSQPGLSKMVRSLETELGVTIFIRSSSGITLTPEGKDLLRRGSLLLHEAEQIKKHFQQEVPKNHEELRVCSQHYCFVIDAFTALQTVSDKNSYTYQLILEQSPKIIQMVAEDKASLGILFFSSQNRKIMRRMLEDRGLEFHGLFSSLPSVFLHKSHPLADRDMLTLEDLEKYPRILYASDTDDPPALQEEFLSAELSPAKTIIINDLIQSLEALTHVNAYDLGVGLITPLNRSKGIVVRPLKDIHEPVSIGYIMKKQHPLSSLEEALLKQILKYKEEIE